MTKSNEASFNLGWLAACDCYAAGYSVEQIEQTASTKAPYFQSGMRAALEAILGDPAEARGVCHTIGISPERTNILLEMTRDV